MQKEIGGEIVFFYHDSDHDPRETKTILRHRKTGELARFNFTFENRLQRKFAPLYLKRVAPAWHAKTTLQLPAFVDRRWVRAFQENRAPTVADFCLEMYRQMGLLDGIRVARSSDPSVRRAACDVPEYFVDVPHEGEIVRARFHEGRLQLHEGGDSYITLPIISFTKAQISPTRDTRLPWMQSVVHCTHYIAGASEQAYLRREGAPEIAYVNRDTIDRSDEAYTDVTV
ncbi:MAG TPA: hypothetical protein VMV72_06280 [Verrucomicrobiae bacterium]|nr:hypothetical protein [Verrucomicrobiae bacterium]